MADKVVDTIICGDCVTAMQEMPERCIDLVVTSPPYLNAREYSHWENDTKYLADMMKTWVAAKRVMKPDGRIAVIVCQGYGRHPYLPLGSAITMQLAELFHLRGHIIWAKDSSGRGSGATSWGSWMSASNPCLRDVHELIIVASNEMDGKETKGESDIERDEFLQWTKSVWRVPAVSPNATKHPAAFPETIAERLIKLYSYKGDVVLDPFLGSGTTAVVAKELGRSYIGIELNPEYAAMSEKRLAKVTGTQLRLLE